MATADSIDRTGRFRIGDLVLDTGAIHVERAGESVALPRLSFRMLECLARNAPNAVSFDQLMDDVWDGVVVNQETVIQRARLLREAIGDDSRNPEVVETVRGFGYRLIPEVENLEQSESIGTGRRRAVAGFALAGLIAAVLFYLSLGDRITPEDSSPSIAILPMVNMSSDAEQEILADGLTVELTSLLTRVPELHVAAHTSAFTFKDSNARIDDIADALNVSHILEGSVRRFGDDIRVTVQLIEAGSGFNMWTETYERRIESVFEVQDEIATSIVRALRPALEVDTPTAEKTDTRAYAHYLRALHFDNLKGEENWRQALEHFQLALDIDPEFAAAWAGLSTTYFYVAANHLIDLGSGMELARDAAERALSIDANQADALATLSLVRSSYDWDFAGAEAAIREALILEPGNSNVLNRAGALANALGQADLAVALYKRSITTDPLNMSPRNSLAQVFMGTGELTLAQSVLEELDRLNPDYPWGKVNLGRIRLLQGEARVAQDLAGSVTGFWHESLMIMAAHALGQKAEAHRRLEVLAQQHAVEGNLNLAELYAWQGDYDAAFRSLDRAAASRDPWLIHVGNNPFLAVLQSDERWAALMNRIGLVEPPRLELPPPLRSRQGK